MSKSLARLEARKQVLIAELELQRMQMSLHAADARNALRPAGLLGASIARPAALVALVDGVARLFGWHRAARYVRLAALALAAFRVARVWRSHVAPAPSPAPPGEPAE
jgi:hypothetical protein